MLCNQGIRFIVNEAGNMVVREYVDNEVAKRKEVGE